MRKYSTIFTRVKYNLICAIALIVCSLGGCQHEPTSHSSASISPKTEKTLLSSVDLLFFKAEQKLEVWQRENNQQAALLFTLKLSTSSSLPIGIFQVNRDSTLKLSIPGQFYKEKLTTYSIDKAQWNLDEPVIEINRLLRSEGNNYLLEQLSEVKVGRALVFPNDARKDKELKACFACPHWMTEYYAKLGIELEQFRP